MRCDAMEWVLAGIIFLRAVLGPSISSVSCALDRVWSCLLYGLEISNLEQNKEIEKQVAEAGTQKEGGRRKASLTAGLFCISARPTQSRSTSNFARSPRHACG